MNPPERTQCANKVIEYLLKDLKESSNRRFYLIEDYFTMEYGQAFQQLSSSPVFYISDIRTNLNLS